MFNRVELCRSAIAEVFCAFLDRSKPRSVGVRWPHFAPILLVTLLSACSGNYSSGSGVSSGNNNGAPDTSSKSVPEFFGKSVQPNLSICRTCHVPGASADTDTGKLFMLSSDPAQDYSNVLASWTVLGKGVSSNKILTKPSDQAQAHSGGQLWPAGSQPYNAMKVVLNCWDDPAGCAALLGGGGDPATQLPLLGAVHGRGTREIFCEGLDGKTPQPNTAVMPQDARELIQPGIGEGKAVAFNAYWENCKAKLPESDQPPKTCGEFRKLRDEGEYLVNYGLGYDLYKADGSGTITAAAFNDTWKKWGGGLAKRPASFDQMYTLRYGKNSPHFRNPYPIRKDDGTLEDPNAPNAPGGTGQLPMGMSQMKDANGKWTGVILDQSGSCAGCHGGQVGLPGESPVAGAWWGIPNNNIDLVVGLQDSNNSLDLTNASADPMKLLTDTALGGGLLAGPRGRNDASTGFELLAYLLYDWQSTDVSPDPTKHNPLHGHSFQDSPSWFHQGHQARKFKSGEISIDAHRMTAAAAGGPGTLGAGTGAAASKYRDYSGQRLAAFQESLRSPDWPETLHPIDTKLAEQGAILFHAKNLWADGKNAGTPKPQSNGSCAGCHGAYSPRFVNDPAFLATPELEGMASYIVPMDTIKAEPYRQNMTGTDFADTWNVSWWSYPEGQPGYVDPATRTPVEAKAQNSQAWIKLGLAPKGACEWAKTGVVGYLAPALHGIWTTGPYMHNGSVPTIWQMLDSSKRPKMWRRKLQTIGPVTGYDQSFATGYDFDRIGWKHDELKCEDYPNDPFLGCNPVQPADGPDLGTLALELLQGKAVWTGLLNPQYYVRPDLRFIFDTRQTGAGNQGHEFTDVLTDQERRALIEYLKTL